MAVSQNGWPANNRGLIHTLTVPGTNVRLPVRRGPAGDLLLWAAERWHREVEPLVEGWNWGYAERPIRGGSQLSNHASGTAIDLNAPRHPLGTAPSANFTPAQVAAVRRIVADAGGCLRWGGDYTGRKDGMHLEVVADEGRCAAVLARLTGGSPPPAPNPAPGRPTIQLGSTGAGVQLIQRWLGVAGPGDANYGQFDAETAAAVKRYQAMKGLTPDSVVGPLTWGATGL